MSKNILLKSIAGFYYVKSGEEVIECKAKGKFRNLSLSPLAGDIVDIDVNERIITKIHKRKNQFLRPPFANLDLLVLVISTIEPAPNYLVIDKMCAIAQSKDVEVVMVITKSDVCKNQEVIDNYKLAGYQVLVLDNDNNKDIDVLHNLMKNKITAFAGNSGVGKSSLLNRLFPNLELKTDEISRKLGRGKHTTRHVEIYQLDDCMVADTPGFSSIELDGDNHINANDLSDMFIEFNEFSQECKFNDCRHIFEKGCAVTKALQDGKIAQTRYESYKSLYLRQKEIKDWQLK